MQNVDKKMLEDVISNMQNDTNRWPIYANISPQENLTTNK